MEREHRNNINNRVNSELLVDYLDTTIRDEMILNSFIRDLKIVDSNAKTVIIGLSSKEAVALVKKKYKQIFLQGIENIYEVNLGIRFIVSGDEKYIISSDKTVAKNVSPKYTIANYVESSFNKEVVEIAKRLPNNPGRFSPFFLYSKSGLGKTHLLHAIGNLFREHNLSSVYIEPNSFTRQITELSKKGSSNISDFIESFANYDVLLFDDIQNLGDRTVTLKVLLSIINTHIENDKQIVISSDKSPQELSGFKERFVTRFVSGITSFIRDPEISDLLKVLKQKLSKENLEPEKWERRALQFIVSNNSSSIRALEGAVKRVVFFTENELNIQYTYTTINNVFKELVIDPIELTPNRIINTVANHYKINKDDIIGKSRRKEFVVARHMAMWLIKKINKISFVEIGKIIGNRDHSTIVTAIQKVEQKMKLNPSIKMAASKIERQVMNIT